MKQFRFLEWGVCTDAKKLFLELHSFNKRLSIEEKISSIANHLGGFKRKKTKEIELVRRS